MQDAWIDDQDRLWIYMTRAASTWKSAFGAEATRSEGGSPRRRITRPELYYEGVIEVIDLKRGELLLSEKVPFQPSYALGKNLVAVKEKTSDGDPFLRLVRVDLVR